MSFFPLVASVPLATALIPGIVQPDNVTLAVSAQGLMSVVVGGGGGSTTVPVTTIASSGAAQTLPFAASGDKAFVITLTANCTLSFSGGVVGQRQSVYVRAVQDPTAGRTLTFSGIAGWTGGIAPSGTGAGAGTSARYRFVTDDGGATVWGEY